MVMPLFLAVATEVVNTSNESITNIGIGGVFALLVIREVFSFVKGRKVMTNGYQKAATCVEIVKRFDKNFESQNHRFDKIDDQLGEVKDLIRKKH